MDKDKIKHYFGVDPTSKESLCAQMQRRVEAFLNTAPPGTALPAERIMSESLDISRVTIRNALEPFCKSGRILRQRRNGTIVAPRSFAMNDLNELALGLPWRVTSPSNLRFLSYENLPQQKCFWENAVQHFNGKQSECTVEIVWLSTFLKGNALLDYLEEEEIDLILHSHIYGVNPADLALPLPDYLKTQMQGPDFITDMFPHQEIHQDYFLPLQIVYRDTFWNCELAEQCNLKNVEKRLLNNEKVAMIKEALPYLPAGCSAGSHIWCHLAYQGIVPDKRNSGLLLSVLKQLAELGDHEKSFMTTQQHPLDDVEKFVSGKLLFLDGTTSQIQTVGNPAFHYGQLPFTLPAGSRRMGITVDIAMTKQCHNQEQAEQFLAFLLEPDAQKQVWSRKQGLPVYRPAFEQALQEKYGLGKENSIALLSNTFLFRNLKKKEEASHHFLVFKVRDELNRMMTGDLSPEETARRIINKWERFKKRKLENE
jgi:hypothetical protein